MSKDSSTSTSTFPPGDQAPATTPQVNPHTCEPVGASCQQTAQPQCEESRAVSFTQRESPAYSRRNTAVDGCRRHSIDGAATGSGQGSGSGSTPGQGSGESDRFHPYCRQYRDGGIASISQSYIRLREGRSPLSFPGTPTTTASTGSSCSNRGDQSSWDPYNGSFQASGLMASPHTYSEPPAAPEEPGSFLSPSRSSYHTSLTPLQQFSPAVYSTSEQSSSSLYSVQCLSTPALQDSAMQSLFPKPIYSYSILIFMALRNSKTGSLPVSEIYSFMTENFPYFKTAPDGWKNSVRHNLSLNKCFEKVENKSGNSSRKGCLWALNPAKVEKMQEELHKWRRKDPLTVRKSMARPEDLDRLLGERPDRLKSLSAYHSQSSSLSRPSSNFNRCPSSVAPPKPREPCPPLLRPLHSHVPPPPLTIGQQPHCYLPPVAPHPHPFAFYSPCGQQPCSGVPSTMGNLDSPLAGQTPPACSTVLQVEYGLGPRSMQELLLEGEASNDIDTLNPSLTDLQLHGNLWEELRQDSLAPDSLVVISSSHSSTSPLPTYFLQGCSPRASGPVNKSSEGIAIGRNKGDEEEEIGLAGGSDHQMTGFYPTAYLGVEGLAMYHTSTGTTPIPLL